MTNIKHHDKVKLTVECSFDERTYIKMLAAKKNMTISELLLSSVREIIPRSNEPNAKTIEALEESKNENLKSYKSLGNFWKDMGIDPDA